MGILVGGLELVANACLHMLDGKKADVLIELSPVKHWRALRILVKYAWIVRVTLFPMESVTT